MALAKKVTAVLTTDSSISITDLRSEIENVHEIEVSELELLRCLTRLRMGNKVTRHSGNRWRLKAKKRDKRDPHPDGLTGHQIKIMRYFRSKINRYATVAEVQKDLDFATNKHTRDMLERLCRSGDLKKNEGRPTLYSLVKNESPEPNSAPQFPETDDKDVIF